MSQTILMINDEADISVPILSQFEKNEITCIEKPLSDDCISIAIEQAPSAVIINLGMFESESLELCDKLKEAAADIPILAISHSTTIGKAEELFFHGIDAYITRPFSASNLIKKIHRLVEQGPNEEICFEDQVPAELADAFVRIAENAQSLGDLAHVYGGVNIRSQRFRSPEPGFSSAWRMVLGGKSIHRFAITGERDYVRFDRIGLSKIPHIDEYAVPEKIVLRRNPSPLTASIDRSCSPVAIELYSIIANEATSNLYLCAVLNSRLMDFYCHRVHVASGRNEGLLRKSDIEALPLLFPSARKVRGIERDVSELVGLGALPLTTEGKLRQARLRGDINRAIFDAYGFTASDIEILSKLHF